MAQSELAKATAAESSARAQAAYASSARARAERLLVLKAIARQDYERAIADDVQAQSNLTQAVAELRERAAPRINSGAVNRLPVKFTVRSPMAGVVLQRTASPGVVVVQAPARRHHGAIKSLAHDRCARVATGFAESRRIASLLGACVPGEIFHARIDAVAAGLDPHTRRSVCGQPCRTAN
jgi:hypothetical protein